MPSNLFHPSFQYPRQPNSANFTSISTIKMQVHNTSKLFIIGFSNPLTCRQIIMALIKMIDNINLSCKKILFKNGIIVQEVSFCVLLKVYIVNKWTFKPTCSENFSLKLFSSSSNSTAVICQCAIASVCNLYANAIHVGNFLFKVTHLHVANNF